MAIAGFGIFVEALIVPSRVGQITRWACETACFDMGKMTTIVIYGCLPDRYMHPCADAWLQLGNLQNNLKNDHRIDSFDGRKYCFS